MRKPRASLISEYYRVAPQIVAAIDASAESSSIYETLYTELIVPCVRLIWEGQMETALNIYKETVRKLMAKYVL